MAALFEAVNNRLYWAPTTPMRSSSLWAVHAAVVAALLLADLSAEADSAAIPNLGTEGLPPRTLPTGPALCAPIPWIQKELLIAHFLTVPWAVRREVIPLRDLKVRCRIPGLTKARQQPENLHLPLTRTPDGVEVTVPKLEMYSLVVFE